jgi:predicted NUDIX family NTP pyrophosphohydrolase
MNETLTKENLERVLNAMNQFKEIDRSEYFKRYYFEVQLRLDQMHALNKLQEHARNKEIGNNNRKKQGL